MTLKNNAFKSLTFASVIALLTACGGSNNDSPSATPTPTPTPTPTATPSPTPTPVAAWTMVWNDEFDGDTLDTEKWTIETGDGSQYGLTRWGNEELQWYHGDNLSVADGNLVITAREEALQEGFTHSSGRLHTKDKATMTFGRLEASIQMPAGQGFWGAFWALPNGDEYGGGWAADGEIDVFEAVNPGSAEDEIHGTIHYGMRWPLNASAGEGYSLDPSDGFHEYAVEWEEGVIRWYVDGIHFHTVTSDHWWSYYWGGQDTGYVSDPEAPFDIDHYMILNMAVGGNWPGSPNENTTFPSEMRVDYVRVYECSADNVTGHGCETTIDADVVIPEAAGVSMVSYDIYSDGAGELSWLDGDTTVTRDLQVVTGWDNNGALTWSEVTADASRGLVIDIDTSDHSNVVINGVDDRVFALQGMGSSTAWWELSGAELKFDLYIDSANTAADGTILIKMASVDGGYGAATLNVADLTQDAWTTISIELNTLTHPDNSGDTALDTGAVNALVVIEPTTAAHIQLDNIQLICGHRNANGCAVSDVSAPIEDTTVNVFIDAVDPLWSNGIGAWDTVIGEYFGGDFHIQWETVTSADAGHDQVIDVDFSGAGVNGVFYIQAASPGLDLSLFDTGNVIFDIKVVDAASNTAGFVYKIDCIHPCTSGDIALAQDLTVGQWTTITVPVSTLMVGNFNLGTVNTGLVIMPAWDQQEGVNIQLDNIRWEQGGG